MFVLAEDDDARIAEAAWRAVLQRAERARMALAAVADGTDAAGVRARRLLEDLRRRELIARLTELCRQADGVDLETGALLIASFGDPSADVEAARAELQALADGLAPLPPPGAGPLPQLQALNRHLAAVHGFRLARSAGADPADAYLHAVLRRRRGLPVTLALVWILVGRRAGATVHGINMPGRFLAACDAGGRRVFFDPADGGRPLSRGDCARLLSQAGVAFSDGLLSPVPARLILIRIINNLIELSERRDGPHSAEAAWWERLREVLLQSETGETAGEWPLDG